MNKGKVYATNETNFDFARAEAFGELVFLTDKDINNSKASLHNVALLNDIRRKLRQYDPSMDFILPVGSPYVQACAFWSLGLMGHRVINILRWSNRDRLYTPVYLEFDREEEPR